MRYPIWQKDDFFKFIEGPRIDMDPVVVELKEEPISLGWNYDMARQPVGTVSDIRIENDEITGVVEWFPDMEQYAQFLVPQEGSQEPLCRLGGYYTEVEKRGDTVTKCTLRAVFIMMMEQTPGWTARV